ncbi:LysR family transcriptional regulator [Bosea sp. (in: a-proteobacteria)]|jgi:DNA-binding transcriptional LysR family regulator|uniref:LysR substrate-binding domain-containing protein n=1 Tax=Bosea vestrisii TaxID=151416 RepID=A0ABW0H4L4_9HYPH|nr:LysR family transcriptional regulator [Bosea sp. (in: a-proteobacteria)]MBR3190297.1 LysR family transcriptional regulator [Bosea sp. (in: a-proteobacteria)]
MDIAAALKAFVRTVERGSVTAAARDLSVSQPAVTKHLRNLERHVGARLLERSSRMVRPTVQGKALYEASRSALSIIDAALEGVRHKMGAIEGLLRVHAPSCIGVRHLHPITLAFQERYPDVTIDLVLENRAIDLIHEGFDLALRYGRPDGQELIVRRLGLVRRILVAAPGFIERSGPVETPARLSEIDIVTTPTLLSPRDVLSLRRGGESVDVPVRPVMRTNTAETIVATLLSGRAAGPVQQLLVGEEMAAGRLVRILPDYEVKPTEAFWTFPSVRFMRPVVRAFTDFAIPALRAVEGIDAGDMRSEAA